MALSRKHYEPIAKILRKQHDQIVDQFGSDSEPMSLFNDTLTSLIEEFKTDNRHFDGDRFILAVTGERLHVSFYLDSVRFYIREIVPILGDFPEVDDHLDAMELASDRRVMKGF